jgi:hypothetical protein
MTLEPEKLKEIEESFQKAGRAVRARLAELSLDENSFDRAAQDFYQIVRNTHWYEFSPRYQYEILSYLRDPASDFYNYVFANQAVEQRIEGILQKMNRSRKSFNTWVNSSLFSPIEPTRFKKDTVITNCDQAVVDWVERHAEDKKVILEHIEEIFAKWQIHFKATQNNSEKAAQPAAREPVGLQAV